MADEFLSFLYANPILEMVYDKMLLSGIIPLQRQTKLSANKQRHMYVRTHRRFHDNKDKCYMFNSKEYKYSKDTWSERLYHILKKCYQTEVEFTASKEGHPANYIVMRRMPADTTMDCLIFHGAPDLICEFDPSGVSGS